MVGAAAILLPGVRIAAQRAGASSLMVEVRPEAHLDPSQIPLRFTVSADGTSEPGSQAANISAWVRALPGQQIHLTARIGNLTGPSGMVAGATIAWRGTVSRATAGGQGAMCTAGVLTPGLPQELISGWGRSGTLTCDATFSLENARSLAPGVYTAEINLVLHAE